MEERIIVCMYRRATSQDCFGDGRLREQIKELLVRSKVRGGAVCGWCHNAWFRRPEAERADSRAAELHSTDLKGRSESAAADAVISAEGVGGWQLTFCFPSSDVQQALSFVLDPEAQSLLQRFRMGICQGRVDVLAGDETVQLGVGASIDMATELAQRASQGQVLADDAVAQALAAAGDEAPYEALLHGFCDAHGSNVFACVMKGQGTVTAAATEVAASESDDVAEAETDPADNLASDLADNQGQSEPPAATLPHGATATSSVERRQLRSQAMAALARGEGDQAMAMLQSCCERSKDASALERSRDRLALAIGYSRTNMAYEALENALYALARARESADATAERACILFLQSLYEAECPEEAARW